MTHDLFIRRLAYLVALCRKHTRSSKATDYVRELVDFVKIYGRLPPSVSVRLAGNPVAIRRVAEELAGRATIVPVTAPLVQVPMLVTITPNLRKKNMIYRNT